MSATRQFEYKFQVSFEETNVVGNVYFANYFVWQGKCREAFLAKYAPQVLPDLMNGHAMITKESSCEFFHESFAFNHLVVCLSLQKLTRTTITMIFEYYREEEGGRVLLARGQQKAIWAEPGQSVSMLPEYLYNAIRDFNDSVPEAE